MTAPGTGTSQLIIQRDHRMVVTPGEGRDELVSVIRWCAQLRRIVAESYEYELSPLAIWGAASRGVDAARMLDAIAERATSGVPKSFRIEIIGLFNRYGALRLRHQDGQHLLVEREAGLVRRVGLDLDDTPDGYVIPESRIGQVALAATRAGWPIVDERQPVSGTNAKVGWSGPKIPLRNYQQAALESLVRVGSGVVLLPCGAGKTIVGIAALIEFGRRTLILAPSREIGAQWRESLIEHTTLTRGQIASNERPQSGHVVAIVTYQSATTGTIGGILIDQPWGFVIYDEVHALPADVFRISASLPAARRLGLTATLVREDGRERDAFALVGPPVYEASWRELERQGWLAPARCFEVRFPAGDSARETARHRVAVVERLLHRHREEPRLVIGTHLRDLRAVARSLDLPLITGSTPTQERERIYDAYRRGEIHVLAMSRVGGFGVDLPNASVLIQISGNFGSRQEEAQRLGRILRPAERKQASFYSLVATGTREEEFARRRQRYLVDRGYQYEIIDASSLPRVERSHLRELAQPVPPRVPAAQTTDKREPE